MTISSTNKLIIAFVAIIVGVVLIASVANTTQGVTTRNYVYGELVNLSDANAQLLSGGVNVSDNKTLANAPSGWKQSSCQISDFTYRNASGDFTVSTDYELFADSGILRLTDTAGGANGTIQGKDGNTTYMDYRWCPDDYIVQSWSRTMLQTAIGMFALGILGAGIYLFFAVARENGLVGANYSM